MVFLSAFHSFQNRFSAFTVFMTVFWDDAPYRPDDGSSKQFFILATVRT
jgi:hypothetical protein